MTKQMADSHLVYIPSVSARRGVDACYDVYLRDGGPQLGWVLRRFATWTAISDDPMVDDFHGNARWEVATAMWGDAAEAAALERKDGQ